LDKIRLKQLDVKGLAMDDLFDDDEDDDDNDDDDLLTTTQGLMQRYSRRF
jgi:hypothetical protein